MDPPLWTPGNRREFNMAKRVAFYLRVSTDEQRTTYDRKS
jgi:hypothetical protein